MRGFRVWIRREPCQLRFKAYKTGFGRYRGVYRDIYTYIHNGNI